MTEEEWLAEHHVSHWMLDVLTRPGKIHRTKVGRRKLRLFSCGCCRMAWHLLDDAVLRPALEVAERVAGGEAGKEELQRRSETIALLLAVGHGLEEPALAAAQMMAGACAPSPQTAAYHQCWFIPPLAGLSVGSLDSEAVLCHLVRDVFGNPFRPAVMKREWIAANDRSVEAVARSIYDERAFDRMPILADALEDAGCDDETILAHCRGPGPHVRGCWVVDSILGKG